MVKRATPAHGSSPLLRLGVYLFMADFMADLNRRIYICKPTFILQTLAVQHVVPKPRAHACEAHRVPRI